MQQQPRRDTAPERALRSALHAAGLRYRVDFPIPATRRRADVAFPKGRVVVFVDGCFWHGCPDHGTWPKRNAEWWRAKIEANRRRDRDTDVHLQDAGWTVVRVWEHDNPAAAARRIAELVRS
jgi:DNA mismatch endonuclease, patch repair protein